MALVVAYKSNVSTINGKFTSSVTAAAKAAAWHEVQQR